MSNLTKIKHAKTRKGKLILQKREPQLVEDTKHVAFIRGGTANETIMQVMRDIAHIKKPFGVLLNKKNDIRPFEDQPKVEFLCDRNQCPLFVFGSHNKKRPVNLILGRTFEGQVLDMFEFGVENYKKLTHFKNTKTSIASKPIIMFAGEAFDTQHEYIRMKNFLLDFFSGRKMDGVRLSGLESVISVVAVEGKILFRHFRVILLKSGTRIPRVELEEIGPRFDLSLRRSQLAFEDLFKTSLRQPYQLKPKKEKNISQSNLGTTFGRIHMERQDYTKLATKKVARMGRVEGGKKRNLEETPLERLNRLNPVKKARNY